jgi:hypothetical protein
LTASHKREKEERERERERRTEKLRNKEDEFGIKRFAPSVVSSSSLVVAHMMATGGLHGR